MCFCCLWSGIFDNVFIELLTCYLSSGHNVQKDFLFSYNTIEKQFMTYVINEIFSFLFNLFLLFKIFIRVKHFFFSDPQWHVGQGGATITGEMPGHPQPGWYGLETQGSEHQHSAS